MTMAKPVKMFIEFIRVIYRFIIKVRTRYKYTFFYDNNDYIFVDIKTGKCCNVVSPHKFEYIRSCVSSKDMFIKRYYGMGWDGYNYIGHMRETFAKNYDFNRESALPFPITFTGCCRGHGYSYDWEFTVDYVYELVPKNNRIEL